MKRQIYILLLLVVFLSIYSCKKDEDNIICACYIFSFDFIESNYFVEVMNDGTIRTSEGMRRGYGKAFNKDYISREELPMDRDSLLSQKTFPDSVWDKHNQCWYFNGYTHMKEKSAHISEKKLMELRKLLKSLPEVPSKNILCDYSGEDLLNKAGVVIMIKEKNYVLIHGDYRSDYYPIYKFISALSPIPIKPRFDYVDDCYQGNIEVHKEKVHNLSHFSNEEMVPTE